MKVIIAGGRDYKMTVSDKYGLLETLAKIKEFGELEIVHGACKTGVDLYAKDFAYWNDIPCTTFPADWGKHGRAAGPIRNNQMAEYADAVILFPGGRGTQSMYNEAVKAGIKIFDFRNINGE